MMTEGQMQHIMEPLDARNGIAFVDRSVHAICNVNNSVEKEGLLRILRDGLTQLKGQVAEAGVSKIEETLSKNAAVAEVMRKELGEIGSFLRRTASPKAFLGQANCLFIVEGIEHFGALSPLKATPKEGKGIGPKPLNPRKDLSIPMAYTGAWTAIDSYFTSQGMSPSGRGVLLTYDIPIEIVPLTQSYEGTSVGLAFAMATLSWMTQIPIPSNMAFTGHVNIDSQISSVGGVRKKVEAAINDGMEKILIPAGNISDISKDDEEKVCPVGTLVEAVEAVAGLKEAVVKQIHFLNTQTSIAAQSGVLFKKKMRRGIPVLISCIGKRDPYSMDEKKRLSEGAALATLRYINPRAVLLLATPGVEKEAEATYTVLSSIVPSCRVMPPEPLHLPDPTVYDAIYDEIHPKIMGFLLKLQNEVGECQPYIAISSGTPQMQTVLIQMITHEPLLYGSRVFQARDPKYIKAGEESVREVESRILNVGLFDIEGHT